MRLKFKGVVQSGNDSRQFQEEDPNDFARVYIGGCDFLEEVERLCEGVVTVTLDGELLFSGDSVVTLGWGYSEFTPMEGDSWYRDGEDVLSKVLEKEGQEVTLVVEGGE